MNDQEVSILKQSAGADPKAKRNSGLFSFLRWFKSPSRESVSSDPQNSTSGSSDSLNSTGTAASFSFIAPTQYGKNRESKCIQPGPETDTYKARLKLRDKNREKDKDVTLRKKYNLFFNRGESLSKKVVEEDSSKSLPLMTRKMEDDRGHRRTNSESSKSKKAGAYLHVKGKRKAPQPPVKNGIDGGSNNTLSLRRKKRLAPQPPAGVSTNQVITVLQQADILSNDSLKLDHGILKPAKEENVQPATRTSIIVEPPVSPRPWYKRPKETKKENKYEPVFNKELKIETKKEEKRKSGLMFLTNISELDREASEIVKQSEVLSDMPEFMRPRQQEAGNSDSLAHPKRKSAKDLIAKFNAITNVTKVTVNSAFFGARESPAFQKEKHQKDYFGRSPNKTTMVPLMKSETSACIIKQEKKTWSCPKCNLENDYWRIICHVCSTIKPYFDDLGANNNNNNKITTQEERVKNIPQLGELERSKTQIGFSVLTNLRNDTNKKEEREKLKKMLIEMKNSLPKRKSGINQVNRKSTIDENPELQIPQARKSSDPNINKDDIKLKDFEKKDENILQQINNKPGNKTSTSAQTSSVIKVTAFIKESSPIVATVNSSPQAPHRALNEKTSPQVVNKFSRQALSQYFPQTKTTASIQPNATAVPMEPKTSLSLNLDPPTTSITANLQSPTTPTTDFQLMRPKDFEDIYSEKSGKQTMNHLYANLAHNENLFLNVPKRFSDIKSNVATNNNADTLEINRLLRRLETAIARGDLSDAAIYARELAQLKVNCSVVRQKIAGKSDEGVGNGFMVEMYVEDRLSHRGPFPIQVTEDQTVAQLKQQVEREFEIPASVQRWILGKELASNDEATLKDHKVVKEGCPVFLYLVAPTNPNAREIPIETKDKMPTENNEINKPSTSTVTPPELEAKVVVTKKDTNLAPRIVEEKFKPIDKLIDEKSKEILKITDPITKNPPIAIEEDFSEYDKTLRPIKKTAWECRFCTLLNPLTCNICQVCSSLKPIQKSPPETMKHARRKDNEHYLELVNLDQSDLVPNADAFECVVCFLEIGPLEGVTLRECLHQFCKICLAHTVEFCEEAEVKCPYRDDQYSCDIALQDREVKALVAPAVYDQFLARSVAQAENRIDKSFHCKTPDCKGWCIFEDNVNEFRCPVCRRNNCLNCQAIHEGVNCKQYQERMNDQSGTNEDARRTKEMLDEMVNKGEALACPACQVIMMKKWGCDWVRCSVCKTEICWVTKGLRWGPAGKGDTTGGCKCGVNGTKCHPNCNYCH